MCILCKISTRSSNAQIIDTTAGYVSNKKEILLVDSQWLLIFAVVQFGFHKNSQKHKALQGTSASVAQITAFYTYFTNKFLEDVFTTLSLHHTVFYFAQFLWHGREILLQCDTQANPELIGGILDVYVYSSMRSYLSQEKTELRMFPYPSSPQQNFLTSFLKTKAFPHAVREVLFPTVW